MKRLLLVVCVALLGCDTSPPPPAPPPADAKVEIVAPGVDVKVDGEKVEVKAPGADVEVDRSK